MMNKKGFTPPLISNIVYKLLGKLRAKRFARKSLYNQEHCSKLVGGFTLIETLVAIGVLTLAISGVITLTYQSIRAASLSKNRIIAFNLAEEGVELVRNIRDSNFISSGGDDWMIGLDPCFSPNFCYIDSTDMDITQCTGSCPVLKRHATTKILNYNSGDNTIYTRKITLFDVGDYDGDSDPDEVRVRVEILWNESFTSKNFVLEANLFKWR